MESLFGSHSSLQPYRYPYMFAYNGPLPKHVSSLEQIENDFLHGNFDGMRSNRCPKCGGPLFYSVSPGSVDVSASPGRRRSCGMSIYCSGDCHYMLSHLDGFCSAWAEEISDWEAFSASLYE